MVAPTICHSEFVVVERSPDLSGFHSGSPTLKIRGGEITKAAHPELVEGSGGIK